MERQESETEKFITSRMIAFINQHIQSSHLNSLDEIVLSYVVTVFETLATESLKNLTESFDLEEFCEMLTAYFPEFSCIPQSVVSEWIFELVSALKKLSEKSPVQREDKAFQSLLEEIDRDPTPRSKRCSESSSESSFNGSKKSSSSRTPRVSETSDGDVESEVVDIIQRLQLEEKTQTIIEMFPSLPRSDAQNFVALSNGDLEKTVQMVLLAMEGGSYSHIIQSPNGVTSKPRNGKTRSDVDEKALKKSIVERYGFIDQAEDKKEFRPAPLKFEKPKLVRYREGQVVSTKGERYTEVRVKDGEEVSKPYMAKPNKQN